jgi:hypothetical protein
MFTPAAAAKIAKAESAQLSPRWKQRSNTDASSWGKQLSRQGNESLHWRINLVGKRSYFVLM